MGTRSQSDRTRTPAADMVSFQDVIAETGNPDFEANAVEANADDRSEDTDDVFACLWDHAISLPSLPDRV